MAEIEIVTEETFPWGVRCYMCRQEILNGYPFYSIANLGEWLTAQGVHTNAHVIVCGECLPEPEGSTDMSNEELELCITVKGHDISTKLRNLVEDSESGLDLTTVNYAIEVKSIARADGLSFAIDEDFADFLKDNADIFGGRTTEADIARKAYYAGRKTK